MRRHSGRQLIAALAVASMAAAGCAPESESPLSEASPTSASSSLDPPAIDGAFAPELWADDAGLAMTWLEPLGETREEGHRVRFASLDGESWSAPVTVVEGQDLFANWADFPGVARDSAGNLIVHWLAKTAPATFAYSIYLARSTDGGASWEPLGKLNDDETHTEHGFVSWTRTEAGKLHAFWLDGREMAEDGPMTLRGAELDPGAEVPFLSSSVVDERVCECCSTDAALGVNGAVVVYRDRSDEEVRDVRLGFAVDGETVPVGADGWRIEGCPVNGPAVAADGLDVTSVWFTAAADRPSVLAATSRDGGVSFAESIVVDSARPLGRVDLAALGDGSAAIAWFGSDGERASVNLRRISADGSLGEVSRVAQTSMARASGFPRLVRLGDSLMMAWVELADGSPSRIRLDAIPMTELAG